MITGEESVKAGIIQELKNKYASEDGLVENNTPKKMQMHFLNMWILRISQVPLPGVLVRTG